MTKRRAYVMPGQQPTPPPPGAIPSPNAMPMAPVPSSAPAQVIEPVFPWGYPKLLSPQPPSGVQFPPYFRPVTSVFPSTKECADACRIPLGLVVSPAIVSDVPEIDGRSGACYRCSSCSSYLCTRSQVSPDNRSWRCPLCGKDNHIMQSLDATPFNLRPELTHPVYDVIAPDAYSHIESGPAILFILDMSYHAWELGFTQQMIATIKASIDSVPEHYLIGLMTMSSQLSLFDLKNRGEIVLSDLSDCSLSGSVENLCQPVSECKEAFCAALDLLSARAPTDPNQGHCVGSAYYVAARVLARTGGIVLLGCCGLPRHGPYLLQPRVKGEEGEVGLLRLPKDGSGKFYREVAFMLNRASVSVHLFTAGTDYMDVSTICVPPGLTCGSCNTYGAFDEGERQRMHNDLFARMADLYCWDSSLRLRCSKGIKIIRPHTNCTLRKGDLVSFPVIARNDAIAFELGLETSLDTGIAIFQLAMVYTDTHKRRMIRVFTFETPVSPHANVVCNAIDEAALTTLMMRRSVTAVLTKGPVPARIDMSREVAAMFLTGAQFGAEYHLMHSMLGNLLFCDQFPGGVDARMALIIRLRAMSLNDLLLFLYPRMFVTDASNVLVPLGSQAFGVGSCVLVHTVDRIYIWISSAVSPSYLSSVFGVSSIDQVPADVPTLTSAENSSLRELLEQCWTFSGRYLPVEIMTQGDPREAVFATILKDDAHPNVALPALPEWARSMNPAVRLA